MAAERRFAAASTPTGRTAIISSPFQFYTSGEESIRVESFCSAANVRLAVHWRFLPDGETVIANAETHVCTSDRSRAANDYYLGPGALMNLTVAVESGTPVVGQCYVRVLLVRGYSGATIVLGTLLQGYVAVRQDLAWPGSAIQSPLDGPGWLRALTGIDPSSGEILETVPTGARWQMIALAGALTTGVPAGDRRAMLVLDNGALAFGRSPMANVHPASTTVVYDWQTGLSHETVVNAAIGIAGVPHHRQLRAGYRAYTFTFNFNPSDRWTDVALLVEEWIEP